MTFRLGETPIYFQTADSAEATGGSAINFDDEGALVADEEPSFGSSVWGVPDPVLQADITLDFGHRGITPTQEFHGAIDRYAITQTGEEVLQSFDSMSPDALYALQLQLLLTGFDTRKPDKVVWGTPDPVSYRAFARAVATSARSGRTLSEILNAVQPDKANLARLGGGSGGGRGRGGGGGQVRTNVIQHMSDEDLEAAALEGFQTATGHAATPEQEKRFITAFRMKETAAQPETAGGGTFNITDPGNPSVVAEAMARDTVPEDAKSYARLQKFGVMLQALGVGSGS